MKIKFKIQAYQSAAEQVLVECFVGQVHAALRTMSMCMDE
jgi:hypothetical protein